MNKERFEIFADEGKWVVKDNEQLPHLLDLYKCCVRLNEFVEQIAELEEQLKNAVVLKPDRYVIVSNGWKKRVWGIAKIQQEVCDNFIYCSDNYIGCYSPFWQYGEFATKKEAEAKVKEIKGENK